MEMSGGRSPFIEPPFFHPAPLYACGLNRNLPEQSLPFLLTAGIILLIHSLRHEKMSSLRQPDFAV
jgi:hypothetical protein